MYEIRKSSLEGQGLFATQRISLGNCITELFISRNQNLGIEASIARNQSQLYTNALRRMLSAF